MTPRGGTGVLGNATADMMTTYIAYKSYCNQPLPPVHRTALINTPPDPSLTIDINFK